MDRLHSMRVFAKVAESGSFAEAARQLGLSPPAVTRAVSALEEGIGVQLLVRTTRSVKLTEAGAGYIVDAQRILAEVEEAEAAAAGSFSRPTGLLTVTASILFGQMYVLPILTAFLDAHPDVRARALFVDRIVHLVDEGVDVAIRIGELPDSSLRASRVGSVRRVICASPAYLERMGIPTSPDDLANHQIVAAARDHQSVMWNLCHEDKPFNVKVSPRLTCSTNQAAIMAATHGWGLTRVLSYQVGPALASGELVVVLESFEPPAWPVHVVHPEGRAPAKVRAFVDLAVQHLRANPLFH